MILYTKNTYFSIFYNNTENCIINSSWASYFFSVHRGVRQVCPLSPYRNSSQSSPEKSRHKRFEIKWSQYADNTTCGSEKSLSEALRTLESFEKVSGLRLNNKKALWIGSCAGKSESKASLRLRLFCTMKYMHQYKQKKWKYFGIVPKINFFLLPLFNLLKSRFNHCPDSAIQ